MKFEEWLEQDKQFTHKVSHDIVSRLNRVYQLLSISQIDDQTLSALENCESFKILSVSVKSQLRRCVRLNLEFQCK